MSENIFADVIEFCHGRLLNDEKTLNYLINDRQLTIESINKFQIGLFPNNLRDLFAVSKPKELRSAGIIRHASSSTFMTHNLVMPIRDVYGEYIAMAGRTLLSEIEREKRRIPKYMNSVYKKSHHLFGLNFAKQSILNEGIVYIVEGYFDVIMPHQKGMENIVATCGAFLSTRHMALLTRYVDKIVLILDNEPEAQAKARKIVEKKQISDITLDMRNPLTDAKDIDEYLKNHTIEELKARLNGSGFDIRPLWD